MARVERQLRFVDQFLVWSSTGEICDVLVGVFALKMSTESITTYSAYCIVHIDHTYLRVSYIRFTNVHEVRPLTPDSILCNVHHQLVEAHAEKEVP